MEDVRDASSLNVGIIHTAAPALLFRQTLGEACPLRIDIAPGQHTKLVLAKAAVETTVPELRPCSLPNVKPNPQRDAITVVSISIVFSVAWRRSPCHKYHDRKLK